MPIPLVDLAGKRFGRLLVLKRVWCQKNVTHWLCKCDCGNEKAIAYQKLAEGQTKSCGCLSKEITSKRMTTHGLSKEPEFHVWVSLRQRCNNPNHRAYKDYGGRGIKVCKEWDESFKQFMLDMGSRPYPKAKIDRIDNNDGYSKNNCRWTDQKTNCSNTRKTTVWNVFGKNYLSTKDAGKDHNVSWGTIINWCKGRQYKTGSIRLPKEGCSYGYLYKQA